MKIRDMAEAASKASISLAAAGGETKNGALAEIARALESSAAEIIRANMEDLDRSGRENLAGPLMKRLAFDEKKICEVIDGIRSLIALPDPVGKTQLATELDEGLELYRVSCPIGVIGIIFESRPDALVQISSLCLKSGNAALIKGGSEARETNAILAQTIRSAGTRAGLPEGWLQLLETRADVGEMLKMDEYIDLIIPRGSNEFVRHIMDNSRIPVLGHADGICHCYVDARADIDLAVNVVVDSKTQYVAVCNAAETLLVHSSIAPEFLPAVKKALESKNVSLVGCDKTRKIIDVAAASEEDWKTEYLDYLLSIKVVESVEQAIDHINRYGSGHTDAIITTDKPSAARFMDLVDSGNVFWNCSTRFSDGFRYGFGAEVGISTNKIHARGPVGLDGLLIYKYKLAGSGQIVADYAEGRKKFTHRPLSGEFKI